MATYSSPEAAAIADVPPRFARVLVSSRLGEAASVLVAENEPPVVHYHLAVVRRQDDGWKVLASSGSLHNGDEELWVTLDQSETDLEHEGDEPPRGLGVVLRAAPAGAGRAVLEWQGAETAAPVRNGFYLFMADDAAPDWEPPALVRYEPDADSTAE